MLSTAKNALINVNAENVIEKARKHDLDVQSIKDFRKQRHHYDRIEEMMDYYGTSFTNTSILSGLTTGIGSFTTSVTFASLDTITLAIQLYRLSQRFAILNGFDGNDPLQKDKILNLYFEALAINGTIKAALKYHLLKADDLSEAGEASQTMLLKVIIKAGKLMGKDITSKDAGRLIPIIGGIEGAVINYSIARLTSAKMKKKIKRAYFKTWQGEEID